MNLKPPTSANLRVSVVVPLHNAASDISDLMGHLHAQSPPIEEIQIILVDNNSTDQTGPEILRVASKAPDKWNILAISCKEIQSSYAARNAGLRVATGEVIAFLDSDVRPQANWLKNLIKNFCDPAVGIVAGGISPYPGTTVLERHAERVRTLDQIQVLKSPFPYAQTANLAVRREVFLQIGLFRPYMLSGGDADLCWRMSEQTSWQLLYAEDALVLHKNRKSVSSLWKQYRRYGWGQACLLALHGKKIYHEFSRTGAALALLKWTLMGFPRMMIRFARKEAEIVDVLRVPISLITGLASSVGRSSFKFSSKLTQIDNLNEGHTNEPPT